MGGAGGLVHFTICCWNYEKPYVWVGCWVGSRVIFCPERGNGEACRRTASGADA